MATLNGTLSALRAEPLNRPGAVSIRAMLRSWAAELAPFPSRWRRAARVAFVTAIGAAVMASLQIVNPLGLTLLVSLAAPEYAFSFATGAVFLIAAAAIQTFVLFLIGALVDNPVALICVFIALTGVSTYLIYGVPALGRLWLWVQIPSLTAFYMVLFDHRTLGWDNAQMFAGTAIAVALLLLFNNLIWPMPAESVLASSLQSTLERSRRRLGLLIEIFLDDLDPEHDRAVASKLGRHLMLLQPAMRKAAGVRQVAKLLATVMVAERIHNAIDRLSVIACGQAGRAYEQDRKRELREAVSSLDSALAMFIDEISRPGQDRRVEDSEALELFHARLKAMTEKTGAARDEGATVAVAAHLEEIGELLQTDSRELPDESPAERLLPAPKLPLHTSRFLVRFCVRHTVAMTVAFIAGLFDNNAALHAALWLLMIGGPPSHGATARKFTMRAIGASGALAFTALGTLILAPNFTSIPPYMAVIFVAVLLMTYVGEGGGELSFLAIGATAFVIAFSGPGPRPEIVGSIWTIWGISFGMIIRAIISAISIEHPNRTLAEEIERPLAALTMLARGARSQKEVALHEMEAIGGIEAMANVAADAQLTGRSAGIDAQNLIDALDTMRRLTFVLGNDARNAIPHGTTADRIDLWLTSIRTQLEPGKLTKEPLRTMVSEATVLPSDRDEHLSRLIISLEAQLATI